MKIILYTLVAGAVLATLGSAFYHPKWWIRIWDVIHIYMLFYITLVIVFILWQMPGWQWEKVILLILMIIVFIIHALIILPYTPLYPKEVKPALAKAPSFSLLSINVLKTNTQYHDFTTKIKTLQPDLVFVIEFTPEWKHYLIDHMAEYPHHYMEARTDGFGLALFSKFPLSDAQFIYLIDKETPVLQASIHLADKIIYFAGIHPNPPLPKFEAATKEKDVATLLLAQHIKTVDAPIIVAGDFNDVSWSNLMRTFKENTHLKDPRIGRGFYNTFHAQQWYMRIPIDHIFVSKQFRLLTFQKVRLKGSDHFGLFIRLQR